MASNSSPAPLSWLKAAPKGYDLLFYFMPASHVLDNLAMQRLKISNFKDCNDLFELASFRMAKFETREKHRKWVDALTGEIGLICFSSRWNHPLMWAHYADRGKGVCLGFHVKSGESRKVHYTPKRQQRAADFSFPTENDNKSLQEFCSVKFSAWKYERESRLFCRYSGRNISKDDNGLRFRNFGSDLQLVGIINGPKPDLTMSEIRSAFREKVNFFQCRPAFTVYEMRMNENVERWK